MLQLGKFVGVGSALMCGLMLVGSARVGLGQSGTVAGTAQAGTR